MLERRPAPVFFVPAGALLAGVVEQPLRDVLPDRVAAIQADRIGSLDFHGPLAAAAGDAQHVALNFGKTSLPHLGCRSRRRDGSLSTAFPVFRREARVRSRGGRVADFRGRLQRPAFPSAFGVGMRQLAGRSVIPN